MKRKIKKLNIEPGDVARKNRNDDTIDFLKEKSQSIAGLRFVSRLIELWTAYEVLKRLFDIVVSIVRSSNKVEPRSKFYVQGGTLEHEALLAFASKYLTEESRADAMFKLEKKNNAKQMKPLGECEMMFMNKKITIESTADGDSTKRDSGFTVYVPVEIVDNFLEEFDRFAALSGHVQNGIYRWGGWSWTRKGELPEHRVAILPEGKMDEIMQDAVMFLESKDFYYEKGIPWRRGYLFYGIPGSGKTSLAIWLSTCLHKSLYCISSRDCSCGNFEDALAGLPTGAIVLIEDVDCLFQSGIGSRENSRDTAGELYLGAKEDHDEDNKMTLSDFLNAVDGVSSHKDGRILIMTTNHVESIDAAILRPGRIDKKIEFTYADDYQLKLLCERMMGVEQGRRIFNEKFKGRKDPVTMAEAENMILPLALEMLEQKKSKPIQNS